MRFGGSRGGIQPVPCLSEADEVRGPIPNREHRAVRGHGREASRPGCRAGQDGGAWVIAMTEAPRQEELPGGDPCSSTDIEDGQSFQVTERLVHARWVATAGTVYSSATVSNIGTPPRSSLGTRPDDHHGFCLQHIQIACSLLPAKRNSAHGSHSGRWCRVAEEGPRKGPS